jgi:lipoprotein-anchoring transpeptidase ErfK/SrfK
MRKTIALLALGAALALGATGCKASTGGKPERQIPASTVHAIAVPVLTAAQMRALPAATTTATLAGAPLDTAPEEATGGIVVNNAAALPLFSTPGGTAFAQLPVKQLGNDTWLPVIAEQPGWVRVLLPSRPNGSTGWLDASKVRRAATPYLIQVGLKTRTVQLINVRTSAVAGNWKAAIGAASTPTPTGRTFVLAQIIDRSQTYSPVILPLGAHSNALDSYGGGPGTVALHTWPDAGTFGTASSHGCVRIPADALRQIRQVPLGTLVQITND